MSTQQPHAEYVEYQTLYGLVSLVDLYTNYDMKGAQAESQMFTLPVISKASLLAYCLFLME